jgi:hypothetical protein
MNPSEMALGLEKGFRCESCNRSKDDVFILPDGRVVCAYCVDCWQPDRAKQN